MRKLLLILAFLFLALGIASCTGSEKINITFEENGGVEVQDMEISISSTSVQLPTPTREGYTFDGWYLDAALTQPFTLASLLTQSGALTLYAKWDENVTSYTMTFESNGGSAVAAITQAAGTPVTAPTNPTKEGFTFGGWYSDSALTTAYTFGNMPAANITLYAKWNAVIVNQTISFEENGGSVVTDITAPVGSTVSAPTAPTKVGHSFGGWYSDTGLTTAYTFTTMPATAITLYAKWTINNYTISFEENGGSAATDITQAYGTTVVAPTAPTKEGHTFDGWYSDVALTTAYTFSTMPAGNITLYAKWTVNNYTITYESNGGSAVAAMNQAFGSTVTAPTAPTRTGYEFGGWYSDVGLTTAYTFTTMPAGNITLYAKWTVNNYTISFEENGGSTVVDITQAYGSTVVAPAAPTKLGHTFDGWYSDVALTLAYTFTTMPAQHTTLYAKWTVNSYTITYEENGGSDVINYTAQFGTALTAPTAPTKVGHTFDGWYSDVALTVAFTFTTMPAQHTTLYAKWVVNNYTISFESNGGNAVTGITQGYGTTVVAPTAPTRLGHTFDGWYSDVALTLAYTFTTMPAQNMTLYAKWSTNSYTISFEENGGSDVPNITEVYGTTLATPTAPTKEGYVFVGWYSDVALTLAYTFTTMPAQNITLYAKWDYQSYTLTYINAEGLTPVIIKANETLSLPTPTRLGYEFQGWFNDELFLNPFTDTLMPSHDVTIYAKWQLAKYLVSYNTHGGNTLDAQYGIYMMEIPIPEDPTREGYDFVGWYFDDAYTLPITNQSMPATAITIHAKWVANNALWSIHDVLTYQPDHVKVRGTIVYEFPNPMDPGYYIADGTGIIFVMAPSDLAVGTIIEFEADFGFFEYVPQLSNLSNRIVITEGTPTTLTYNSIPISMISDADPNDISMMGLPVIITGVIGQQMMNFTLVKPGSGESVVVNYKSITPMSNPFMGHVGEVIQIYAIVHGYDPMAHQWHVVYHPVVAPTYPVLTDADKVQELLDFAVDMLDNQHFYSYQILQIPSTEPAYGATIVLLTTGENASYFNVTTGAFLETTIERHITLRMTITINAASDFVDLTLILMPTEILTISEFIALEDEAYGITEGIVIFSMPDMGLLIIADETGAMLPIESFEFAEIGDKIRVHGHVVRMMDLAIMAGMEDTILEVLEKGLPNPLAPIAITIQQFTSLDVMNTLYWGRYFEVSGTLVWNDTMKTFFLVDDPYMMPILIFDRNMYETLMGLQGFNVRLRGIALPNFDEEPFLMFIFLGTPNDIALNYTDQEFVDAIAIMLQTYLESMTFFPGQVLDLPTEHPLFALTVTYQVVQEDAHLIVQTWTVDPTIDAELWISVIATLTYGTATAQVDIELHVQPIEVLTIESFLQVNDDHLYYVLGVVLFVHPEGQMIIVADETGLLMVTPSTAHLMVGDLILLYGIKMLTEGMTVITNHPDQIVSSVISHDQEIPLIPQLYTVEELNNMGPVDPSIYLIYMDVIGHLYRDDFNEIYYLQDEAHNRVFIFTLEFEDLTVINSFVGTDVRIRGLWMNTEGPGFPVVVFLNRPGDIGPMFTDAELAAYLGNKLEETYETKLVRPGSTQKLPVDFLNYDVEIVYEVLTNASLYNLTTGLVSNTITEHTLITIRATITVGTEVVVVTFDMVVEPIQTSTIAEFLAGDENETFKVRGVVILAQFEDGPIIIADSTGYMFIVKKLPVQLGDEIIVEGIVTIQMSIKLMWDYATTQLIETVSHDAPNPLTPTPYAIPDLNLLDMNNVNHWGRYVEVTGYVVYMEDSFFPMLQVELGEGEFIPFVPMYVFQSKSFDYEELYKYNGFRVVVKGFLMPNMDDPDPLAPQWMIVVPQETDIVLDYDTDQELVDAIILMGRYHLEGQIFRPGQDLDLPSEIAWLGATLSWQFLGDLTGIFDPINGIFLEVTEESIVQLQGTITIGDVSETYIFILTVQPYPILTIEEFYALRDGEYAKLHVVVVKVYDEFDVILQEPSNPLYLHAYGFIGLNEGDEIIIFGMKQVYEGYVYIDGEYTSNYTLLDIEMQTPLIETEMTLEAFANRDFAVDNPLYYVVVKGRLIFDDNSYWYYLTDGINTIGLFTHNMDIDDELYMHIGEDIALKMFIYQPWWTNMGLMWTGYVIEHTDYIQTITFTDAEIAQIMLTYAIARLDNMYKDGLSYFLPLEHPIYGGAYTISVQAVSSMYASIVNGILHLSSSDIDYEVVLDVTATYGAVNQSAPVYINVYAYDDPMLSYNPGSQGELPVFVGETPSGQFAGLYIHEINRNYSMSGDVCEVYLKMPDPHSLAASYYTIQYWDVMTSSWVTISDIEGPIRSYWDNFVLTNPGNVKVRVVTDTGLVSNEVMLFHTEIDTYFSGWYYEMGIDVSGTMYPFVGYGIQFDQLFIHTLDGDPVSGGYTIQWYRVNPYTFEETLIPGATNLKYITTLADVGYYLMLEAKGNEITVGGMLRVLIQDVPKIANHGYITNITNMGFDIGFEYLVDLQTLRDEIVMYDRNGNSVAYYAIEATAIPNVYHVSLYNNTVDAFYVNLETDVMVMVQESEYHMMQGIYIEIYER